MSYEKLESPEDIINIVAVGDSNCGKRSLLYSYANGGLPKDCPPLEPVLANIQDNGKDYILSLWSTSEIEMNEHERLRADMYQDADVFLVCFSLTSERSLTHIKTLWLPEVNRYNPEAPFLLVGTMEDLLDSWEKEGEFYRNLKITQHKQATKIARMTGAYNYVDCSALTGSKLSEVFRHASEAVFEQRRSRGIFCDIL